MIAWDKTSVDLGLPINDIRNYHQVIVQCHICKAYSKRVLAAYKQTIRKKGKYLCHNCATKSAAFRNHSSTMMNEKWRNIEFRNKILQKLQSDEYRDKMHEKSKALWKTDAYRSKQLSADATQIRKQNSSKASKKKWCEPEYREKLRKIISERMKKQWSDAAYRQKMRTMQSIIAKTLWEQGIFKNCFGSEFKLKMTEINKKILSDPLVLKKLSDAGKANWNNDAFREAVIRATTERWKDPNYRKLMEKTHGGHDHMMLMHKKKWEQWSDEAHKNSIIKKISKSIKTMGDKISKRMKLRWQDPIYVNQMATNRAKQLGNIPSSTQLAFYKILDDHGIIYQREGLSTKVGRFVFDGLINKQSNMKKDILIECQGYWHEDWNKEQQKRDKIKFTHIDKYYSDEYEIMYFWPDEIKAKDKVVERLKLKIGVDIPVLDFNFKDIEIRESTWRDVGEFLALYHYIGKGRGGIAMGAYLDDKLIGCAVFSPPLRQNQAKYFGVDSFRELSRFCIHPSYQKKNFASWLLGKTLKRLNCYVVSYADTTVGHQGTIYKAANFRLHHVVPADYWYVDSNNMVMHKRTLYGRARTLNMKEAEFAMANNYRKKFGKEKVCFVFDARKSKKC